MFSYLIRRLGFTIFVVVGITLLVFTISHVVPTDPAATAAGLDATEDQVEAMREMLGLDQPLYVQYGKYLWGLLRLDFGRSVRSLRPVSDDLAHYIPPSIELILVAMFLYVATGVPLGVLSAIKQGSLFDRITRLVVISGVAMPEFWFALILQFVFLGQLGILPSGSRLPVGMTPPHHVTGMYIVDSLVTGNWVTLGASLKHIILPASCLAVGRNAVLIRVTRRSMITALREDYVRTARAKGLRQRTVIWRHAVRNVLMPVITVIGLQTGWLLNTSLVVETVFSWPGLGWYATQSIAYWDFLAVMSVALVVSLAFVLINTIVDVIYVAIDPRVRVEG